LEVTNTNPRSWAWFLLAITTFFAAVSWWNVYRPHRIVESLFPAAVMFAVMAFYACVLAVLAFRLRQILRISMVLGMWALKIAVGAAVEFTPSVAASLPYRLWTAIWWSIAAIVTATLLMW